MPKAKIIKSGNSSTELKYRIQRSAELNSLRAAIREQSYNSTRDGNNVQLKEVAIAADFVNGDKVRDNQLSLIANGERGIKPDQLDALFRFAENCDINFIREYFRRLMDLKGGDE